MQRRLECVLLACILALAAVPRTHAAAEPAPAALQSSPHAPVTSAAVPARYCPEGGSLEGGLCYRRCRPGWKGLGCSCWKGVASYSRGCGVPPRNCQARSFRAARLPPVASRAPFGLVLSADPQLFRALNDPKDIATAMTYNTRLTRAINNVTGLRAWPWVAGGGPVLAPRALAVLGDMTELYREDEADAFRHLYDPSMPRAADAGADADPASGGVPDDARVSLPTWMMLGNHDYLNNVGACRSGFKGPGSAACARLAVDAMRSALTPGCDDVTWGSFPRGAVTSFDASSMAYAFDYDDWHFVVLQYSPRYSEPSLAVRPSMGWLASELSAATAAGRKIVLLLHAHSELGLVVDPTFARLIDASNVVAIFYGHVHIKPWGMTGNYPGTSVPMFNCGASWYHVFCYAEFGPDSLRVGAVVHNGSAASGPPAPEWFGTSAHALLRAPRAKPVLQQFSMNPVQAWGSGAGGTRPGGAWLALLGVLAASVAARTLVR